MSIGASIYSYRHNFSGKKDKRKNPYRTSIKLKLVDLFRPGFRTVSAYDDDLFVGICQYFMRKGLSTSAGYAGYTCAVAREDLKEIDEFLINALFSIDPFFIEGMRINRRIDIWEWRKQFDIFSETKIDGLNFYRNRQSMPLDDFQSFRDIKSLIFEGRGRYGENLDAFKVSPNECHPDATRIFDRCVLISENRFMYRISYGYRRDYMKKGGSVWKIDIESDENENYIDFCLRIFNNYDAILKLDASVIERESKYSSYYKFIKNQENEFK